MKDYKALRIQMVETQIRRRGIGNLRVLEAMKKIPRHEFVSEKLAGYAYDDNPVSIGMGQTISQPFMVAHMTEYLDPQPEDRVLEIGTGSGYQTAILAELAKEVYSVERIPSLADKAGECLDRLGYKNISIHTGDGSDGWLEMAPFNKIIVTAGAPKVPDPLIGQLEIGGVLVIPVGGNYHQTIYKIKRDSEGIHKTLGTGCIFVPLIGTHGWDS